MYKTWHFDCAYSNYRLNAKARRASTKGAHKGQQREEQEVSTSTGYKNLLHTTGYSSLLDSPMNLNRMRVSVPTFTSTIIELGTKKEFADVTEKEQQFLGRTRSEKPMQSGNINTLAQKVFENPPDTSEMRTKPMKVRSAPMSRAPPRKAESASGSLLDQKRQGNLRLVYM